MNESCCLCISFTELYFFCWLLVVSIAILNTVPFVFSRSVSTTLARVLKLPRVSNAFEDYSPWAKTQKFEISYHLKGSVLSHIFLNLNSYTLVWYMIATIYGQLKYQNHVMNWRNHWHKIGANYLKVVDENRVVSCIFCALLLI